MSVSLVIACRIEEKKKKRVIIGILPFSKKFKLNILMTFRNHGFCAKKFSIKCGIFVIIVAIGASIKGYKAEIIRYTVLSLF